MKRLFVLSALIYSGFMAFPQQECIDVIYTSEEDKVLLDCCILEVQNTNFVIFEKGGERDTVTAKAIIKDGQYIELTRYLQSRPNQVKPNVYDPGTYIAYPYEHYEKIFKKARILQFIGTAVTAAGLGMTIAANVKMNQEKDFFYSDKKWSNLSEAGVITMSVGIPLLIVSSIIKSNNRKAMKIINEQKGLTVGCNNYGFGLTYNF